MFIDKEFLKDAIDLHIHVGPDYMPRYGSAITLAEEAAACGMRAILIKGHLLSSINGAYEADSVVENIRVFGGIALNDCNGGLNPRNVEVAGRSGGKMVWLPTVDAAYAIDKADQGHWIGHYVNTSTFGYPRKGLKIIDENGKLKDDVNDILRICKNHDMILGSGHVSPQEALALAEESSRLGYEKLEITHPNAWMEDFNMDVLKKLVSLGGALTLSYGVCSIQNGGQHPMEIVNIIEEVGYENCCLITDYGQTVHPSPTEGLRVFAHMLQKLGVEKEKIEVMIKKNPTRLLSL